MMSPLALPALAELSRHSFCLTNDRDGFIEELAKALWVAKADTSLVT